MKTCPRCGKRFSWWRTAVGEYKEHLDACTEKQSDEERAYMQLNCRGCPADCFKDKDYSG